MQNIAHYPQKKSIVGLIKSKELSLPSGG